jgi:hypothetical protein
MLALLAWPAAARGEESELAPEVGYNYGEIETPRAAALGGAQRAFGNSLTALFQNPANMAATRVYHLGALAQIWPQARRQSYGLGAVDSVVSSTGLAGGLGGTWNAQDPDGLDRQYTDVRFGLAFPFSRQFMLGAAGRYLMLNQDGPGPLDPSLASGGLEDERIVKTVTFDAGFSLRPSRELAIGLVGSNLSNPGHGFLPTSVGGGAGFGSDDFTIEADVLSDFTTWDSTTIRAMAGAEYLAADRYPLRLGYRFDEGAESHAVSGGLGYIDRAFAAEISVRQVVSGVSATAVVLGFSYHLEATGVTPSPGDGF